MRVQITQPITILPGTAFSGVRIRPHTGSLAAKALAEDEPCLDEAESTGCENMDR